MKKNSVYILALLLGFVITQGNAQPDGATLFKNNCTTCHELGKDLVGPNLVGIHDRRDSVWMSSFIKNSTAMIADGDKDALEVWEKFGKTEMTVFQGALNDEEIGAVITYLKTAQPEVKAVNPPGGKKLPPEQVVPKLTPQELIENVILITLSTMMVLILLGIMGSISVYLAKAMSEEEKYHSLTYKLTAVFHGDWRLFTGKYVESSTEGHEYDGIRELDNIMPPWLQGIFYITILFAIGYLVNYHVINPGDTQQKEYQQEMAAAVAKYGEMDVVKITLVEIDDANRLEAAKEIFVAKCAACHANDGGGGVGPNLTDPYWLHGGGLEDIFYTIRNGVPENGMISWKGQVSDEEMLDLASYIRTLKGTTPVKAKEPQGDKYEGE